MATLLPLAAYRTPPRGLGQPPEAHRGQRMLALLHALAPSSQDILRALACQDTGLACFQHPPDLRP